MRSVILLASVFIALAATATASAADDGQTIFYDCMANSQANGVALDARFCQCANDRAKDVLNEEDLTRAARDYSYLQTLSDNASGSEPYSYERYAGLIFADCIRCKQGGYVDCLPPDGDGGLVTDYEAMAVNFEDAQFDLIERTTQFEEFAVDLINVYGAACTDDVRNPIEIWIETINQDGNVVQSTDRLRLDSRYQAKYENYAEQSSARAIGRNEADVTRGRQIGRLPTGAITEVFARVDRRSRLAALLGSSCAPGSRLDRAYRNLLSFELGDPVVRPAGAPRRMTPGVRDSARLEALTAKLKSEREATLANNRSSLPLTCSWSPDEVNGSVLPPVKAGEFVPYGERHEEYAGAYRVELGDESVVFGLYARSKRANPGVQVGLFGLGVIEATGCVLTVTMNTLVGYQGQLTLDAARKPQSNIDACRATTLFRRTSAAFFVTFEQPGDPLRVYPTSAPWTTMGSGACTEEVKVLEPTPLSRQVGDILATFDQQYMAPQSRSRSDLRAPVGFWDSVSQ